jgi:endonuclease G
MKRKYVYTGLTILCVVVFWAIENFYTPAIYAPANKKSDISLNIPEVLLPSSTTQEVVKHQYYLLSYNEKHEQAEWVAYQLHTSHLTNHDRDRPYFEEDPYVKSKSADWRNYRGSGYDRGHLCPAGDRRFSEQAYNETFYTSNISPQNRDFNAGIWNRLEMQVRYWTKKYNELYVFTGGILENQLKTIGSEDVSVPRAFYKLVVKKRGNDYVAIAFLIPNEESTLPLEHFVVSIDELEYKTGIDFLSGLTAKTQSELESSIQLSPWKF